MKWALRDLENAFRAMGAAKSRTALATLGIVIGVMSVLAVSSIGRSAQSLVVGQVSSFGGDLIAVLPGGSQEDGPPPVAMGIVETTLTRADVEAIGRIPGVAAASAYVLTTETVSYRGDGVAASVYGVSSTADEVENIPVAYGRFHDRSDVESFARVAVVGSGVAERLAPDREHLVGERIRIAGSTYVVIGQTAPRGTVFFQDQDEVVYIPVTTAQRLLAGIDHVNASRIRVEEGESVDGVKARIAAELRRRHGIKDPVDDDFSIRSTDQAVAILGGVTDAITGFLIAVTAISLLVGGINVMNVMYVAVKERTREIGLRKALGANSRRILTQFVIESATMASIGGLVGVAIGAVLTYAVSAVATANGYAWPFILPIGSVVQAVLIATAVGVVFGAFPALQASRMDPITALRDE